MTDDELRDKQLLNEVSYNGCFSGDCPHGRQHECMKSLYQAGWSARGEHIAEHPKVRALCEALKFYSTPVDKEIEGQIEWRPHVCDSYSGRQYAPDWDGNLQDEPGEIAAKALKAFEEK